MSHSESTCWTLIEGAVRGRPEDREDLARRYAALIQAALKGRWAGSPILAEVPDASQEVFLELFREGGALHRVRLDRDGSFRGFLYGVILNVARRFERNRRQHRESALDSTETDSIATDEDMLARQFDRTWAESLLNQAASLMTERARSLGPPAERRLEILRLRFSEGLPVRSIAERFSDKTEHVHHEYAKARADFRKALEEVVTFHYPGSKLEVERQCQELIQLLQ
jgi:RNA polymerase sigma factor (sigma-70 family)